MAAIQNTLRATAYAHCPTVRARLAAGCLEKGALPALAGWNQTSYLRMIANRKQGLKGLIRLTPGAHPPCMASGSSCYESSISRPIMLYYVNFPRLESAVYGGTFSERQNTPKSAIHKSGVYGASCYAAQGLICLRLRGPAVSRRPRRSSQSRPCRSAL